jgi:hypothetical protein
MTADAFFMNASDSPPTHLRQGAAAKTSGGLSAANYAFLQTYIHAESGIVIDADKQYLLESRLNPILRSHQIESLDALSERLASRSSPALSKLVVEAMTTNSTLCASIFSPRYLTGSKARAKLGSGQLRRQVAKRHIALP